MENQMNIGDQNSQQIGQNAISQPIEPQIKQKINYWMVLTVVFAFLFVVMTGAFLLNYSKVKNNQTYLPSPTPGVGQEPTSINQQPTNIPTVVSTTGLKLEDFTNKELLGENDNYSVYLINPRGGDTPEKTGEIVIYDKSKKIAIKMNGSFSIFGATIVFNDGMGKYVLLSTGTYTSRTAIILSLIDKKQAVKDFCTSSGEFGDHFFWNDYIVFNNCDTFQNRPWGTGEAPSITAINLKTGLEKTITKSDLTHHFHIKKIEGNNLQYLETFVTKEEDWQNPDNQKTVSKTYNLLSL